MQQVQICSTQYRYVSMKCIMKKKVYYTQSPHLIMYHTPIVGGGRGMYQLPELPWESPGHSMYYPKSYAGESIFQSMQRDTHFTQCIYYTSHATNQISKNAINGLKFYLFCCSHINFGCVLKLENFQPEILSGPNKAHDV